MFCGKCGNAVREGAAFCPKCGNKFSFVPADTAVHEEILPEPSSSETPCTPIVEEAGVSEKKKSALPALLFIILGVILLAGIAFGIWFLTNASNNGDGEQSQALVSTVAVPDELLGRFEYNVSYTELPIGKPLPTAFDNQLSEVRYRLSVQFGEDGKAYLLLYKADVESAATGIFEIFRDYRVNELYQSYYNADGIAKEEVEYIIFEREHMTVAEYVSGQMKAAGLDKESLLRDITAGLPELDGRNWIYRECKYRMGDGVVYLENNKGDMLISFVFMDENKIVPFEASDEFGFLVKSAGEEITFLKKDN